MKPGASSHPHSGVQLPSPISHHELIALCDRLDLCLNPFKIILICYLCNIQLIYIMSTTAISIRLDSDIKKQFENLCKEFGLSTNAAFNLFARTVVREQAIPFPISLNGSESEKRSRVAQKALDRAQSLSAQEAHEWTDEEIDELIAAHRRKKRER